MASSDSQVIIELLAKVDGLSAGLTEAVSAMREAVSAISEEGHKLEEEGKEANETLKEILGVEKFLAFVEGIKAAFEGAHEAFEMLKEGFESTIGKAEEFSLSNAKFAAMMGTSETEAAGLSAALRGVGSSAQEFESMALRLGQRLNTNEAGLREMGIATRDASGELLSGRQLMQSAIATMLTYKAGTDQNAFALEVFGRRAADVYDLMRVGDEQVQHQIDLYRSMGVELEGTGGQSEKLEEALNDLKTEAEALGIKIGQELMPYAQATLEWMGQHGKDLVHDLDKAFSLLTETLIGVIRAVAGVLAAFDEAAHIVKVGSVAADAADSYGQVSADLGTIADQAKNVPGPMGQAAESLRQFADDLKGLHEEAAKPFQMFDPNAVPSSLARPDENPYAKGGGTRRFQAPGKGGGASAADQEDAAALAAATKGVEAEIALEEQRNAHKLAMGRETAEEFVSQQREFENEKYAVQLAGLQQELELPHRTVAERAKTNDEIERLAATHQAALEKIAEEGETRQAAARRKALTDFIQADDERLKSGEQHYQDLAAAGLISASERYQDERALTLQIRGEELARVDAELATLKAGTAQYDTVLKEKQKLEAQLTNELRAENVKRRTDLEAETKASVGLLSQGFFTAFNDMALHGKSFSDAMRAMFESVAQGAIASFEKILEEKLIRLVVEQSMQESADAAMATSQATAAASGGAAAQAARAASDVAQVESLAAVAAAAAYAANVGIPIVGPAVAAGAADAAIASVEAFVPLASAAGGFLLDQDQLVYAHAQEMVLPRDISQGLRSMIAGGQSGAGASSMSIDYHPNVNGMGNDFPALLQQHKDELAGLVWQLARDGAFTRRS